MLMMLAVSRGPEARVAADADDADDACGPEARVGTCGS